jgi:hypothetical protein
MKKFAAIIFISIGLCSLLTFDGKADDLSGKVNSNLKLAYQYLYNNPEKSITIVDSTLPDIINLNIIDYKLEAAIIKGRAFLNTGEFESAFETLYPAYDICPSSKPKYQMQLAVFLGDTYRSLKQDAKASSFLEKAIAIANKGKDLPTLALCYNVMGLINISINKNEKAEGYFYKSLEINRRLNKPKAIASCLNNLCLYENNKPLEKVKLLEEAIRINTSLNASWSIAENYNNMAVQYFYAKQYPQAIACLQKAEKIANGLKAKELISDNYRYKSWIYEKTGDYKNAFIFLKKLYDIEAEMLSSKRVSKIESDKSNQLLAQKESEIVIKQKEYEIKSLKKGRIILVLGAFSILVIVGFIVVKFQQAKRIENLATLKQLAEKERELAKLRLIQTEHEKQGVEIELLHSKNDLTNFACYIKSKNDFLDNLKDEIKGCYNLTPDEVKKHLKKVTATINQYQTNSNEQNMLMEEIEKVNTEFIARLETKHPDLTKNEKHLASLLRIDLSSKDISIITGSNPKTINMARYRLRKKLQLDAEADLTEYIKKL